MKRIVILIHLLILGISAEAASKDSLYKVSFEEVGRLQQSEKRLVLVFIKTSWCGYCKAMEQSVFKQPEVIKRLNKNFYTVFFDAESRQKISFAGHTFSYKPTGENTGTHELAAALGAVNGQVSYPALCILNADNEIIFQHQGFLSKTELIKILMALNREQRSSIFTQ